MQENRQKGPELYVWGALIGLGLGLVSAHLYGRAIEENSPNGNLPDKLSTGDTVKFGLLLLTLVRQVADFGASVGQNERRT